MIGSEIPRSTLVISGNFHTISYCWAHIISDAKELEDFYGEEGRRIKESLQRIYDKAKSFNRKGAHEDIDHLYGRLTFLLDTGNEHLRTRKFVDNLLKRRKEWLFRFVVDPNVEPTNNRAERALRPSVIYRKVSGVQDHPVELRRMIPSFQFFTHRN